MAEFLFHKGSPTYLHPENTDVMNISQFMAQNLRQAAPPLPPPPKHTFEISEGESVEIEKIVAAEKKDGQLFYKVKWVKYTWEAEESIQHLPHLIDGYWREHFYQNINQAVIDTAGITGVTTATTENDFTRNKSVVVHPTTDNREVQKNVAAGVVQTPQAQQTTEKITVTGDQTAAVNGAVLTAAVAAANVGGDHSDVILEFSMAQSKVEHAYQNRIQQGAATVTAIAGGGGATDVTVAGEKKPRRTYPLERKYICAVCNKAFDRNTSLTRHMLVHTREKPFKCSLCDKAFSQNAHLKRHILIHIGQKSYQCNKCGKMFIEKGGLARHEATHSTEKPWVCNQCGKSFVLNEYLQRHLFLHTGQKPYQCNECGRLFADGSSWRAHKLTHNKEKKYKCHICQKMLKCKRNFKKHVQAHSDDKDMKHKCGICATRFPNKKMLKDHTRRARKNHRCPTCKKFLKSKERYAAHMEYHNPSSEKYDPNAEIPGDDLDDDDKDDIRSDMDDSSKSADEGLKSDTERDDVGDAKMTEDRLLTTMLGNKGVEISVDVQQEPTTGSAVSALTALIMKSDTSEENIESSNVQTTSNTTRGIHISAEGTHVANMDIHSHQVTTIPRDQATDISHISTSSNSSSSGLGQESVSASQHQTASTLTLQLTPSTDTSIVQQRFDEIQASAISQMSPEEPLDLESNDITVDHSITPAISEARSMQMTTGVTSVVESNASEATLSNQDDIRENIRGDMRENIRDEMRDSILNVTSVNTQQEHRPPQQQRQQQASEADVAETIILITQNNDVDMQDIKL